MKKILSVYGKAANCFRVGGDEFTVVLNENGFDTLLETLEAINKVVEENIVNDKVVVAIGYSTLQEGDKEVHDVFLGHTTLFVQGATSITSSAALIISPILYSLGFLDNLYPPLPPLDDIKKSCFFRLVIIFSKYLTDILFFSAISFNDT